jgi:hypothetical protein
MAKKKNHVHAAQRPSEELSSAPARRISAQGANEFNL